jgi:hypothetical protein
MRAKSNAATLPIVSRLADQPGRPDPRFDLRYFTGRADDTWWLRLFDAAPPGVACGEITPGYFGIDDAMVTRVVRCAPRARIVTVLRDPIARAWSVATKHVRNAGRTLETVPLDEVVDDACAHLEPLTPVVERWQRAYGEQLGIFWFDDLASDPTAFLAAVLEHIRVDAPDTLPEVVGRVVNSSARGNDPPRALVDRAQPEVTRDLEALEALTGAATPIQGWLSRLGTA